MKSLTSHSVLVKSVFQNILHKSTQSLERNSGRKQIVAENKALDPLPEAGVYSPTSHVTGFKSREHCQVCVCACVVVGCVWCVWCVCVVSCTLASPTPVHGL